jgi:ABC-2 type transport system ATP-binding protein
MMDGVSLRGIGKTYEGTPALIDVDLDVPRGGVLGLLGPNGAGKTTIVRILATLTAPDRGRATVRGFDVVAEADRVRERISLTGQFAAIDDLLTGRETLEMIGRLRKLATADARRRAMELLDRFDLVGVADRRASTYSGGMRRRLDLAGSLVVPPEVLFLDEPTTGLDLRSRLEVWDAVRELAVGGTTILLTTQYLEEADRLTDRVVLLDSGRVVAEGTPAELKSRVAERRLDIVVADALTFERLVRRFDGRLAQADRQLRSVGITTDGSLASVRGVLNDLAESGIEVETMALTSGSLDDVFLALTGHPARAPQVAPHA